MIERNDPIYMHCWKCGKYEVCKVANKLQRLPRDQHGLGLCKMLEGKERK